VLFDVKMTQSLLPPELAKKVGQSLATIHKALDEYPIHALALSFNGGKDCTVLLHLLSVAFLQRESPTTPTATTTTTAAITASTKCTQTSSETSDNNCNGDGNSNSNETEPETSSPLSRIITVCFLEPNGFPEVIQFMHQAVESYSLSLLLIEHKPNAYGLQMFLDAAKQKQQQHQAIAAIFMGNRRTDPFCANLDAFTATDANLGWPKLMRVNPLLDWGYRDIWTYLKTLNIPYCSLYDQGYTSLGLTTNTAPNPYLRQPDGSYSAAEFLQDESKERNGR